MRPITEYDNYQMPLPEKDPAKARELLAKAKEEQKEIIREIKRKYPLETNEH